MKPAGYKYHRSKTAKTQMKNCNEQPQSVRQKLPIKKAIVFSGHNRSKPSKLDPNANLFRNLYGIYNRLAAQRNQQKTTFNIQNVKSFKVITTIMHADSGDMQNGTRKSRERGIIRAEYAFLSRLCGIKELMPRHAKREGG
jgi:hypothetical protein